MSSKGIATKLVGAAKNQVDAASSAAAQANAAADMANDITQISAVGSARNNPFDAIKYKMAAGLSVTLGVLGDSTTRDSSPLDFTPKRYPAVFQETLVSSGQIPNNYTVRRIVWDSVLGKPVWGSTPILQFGVGWSPNSFVGSVSGTTLTTTTGTPVIGQSLVGPGIPVGSTILSGSGTNWTISVAPSNAVPATTTMYGYAQNAAPPLTWDLWQASVSGSIPQYFMGTLFPYLSGAAIDALIFAHGINMRNWVVSGGAWLTQPNNYTATITSSLIAAVEQFRTINPLAPILMLTQHPMQTGTSDQVGDTSYRPAILETSRKLFTAVDDTVYAAYVAAGKPDSLYNGDGVHESSDTGVGLYVSMLQKWWGAARSIRPSAVRHSLFSQQAGQLNSLPNPAFETWTTTTTVPDGGWTATGSPTFSKDTTRVADQRKGYSVRMVSPAGTSQVYMQYQLSGSQINGFKGRPITFAVKLYADQGGSDPDLGRIGISVGSSSLGTLSFTSQGTVTQTAGFRWTIISILVPEDATSIFARIYANASGTADGTSGINIDQVCLVSGWLPMAVRA